MVNPHNIKPTARIISLREKTISVERYISIEQAKIITRVYQQNEDLPVILKRATALAQSLDEISISIDPEELIVSNRTAGIRAGVVFPEAGIAWLVKEIETLPFREQDPFNVRKEDAEYFTEKIEPFWQGKTLEDDIYRSYGEELAAIEKVVIVNQKDHAQGHICPNAEKWLKFGPAGLLKIAREKAGSESDESKTFYESVCITLEASCRFIRRYQTLANDLAKSQQDKSVKENLEKIAVVCKNISSNPPSSFREAIQSVWFLFVILQMESNASSFSPGRMDQYLYPFFRNDLKAGKIDLNEAVELLDALFIKFNQIVYMRNAHSLPFSLKVSSAFRNSSSVYFPTLV